MFSVLTRQAGQASHEDHLGLLSLAEQQQDSSSRDDCHDNEKTLRSEAESAVKAPTRVECLDGLRGLACVGVFNYHFLWPWTHLIFFGHGNTLPGSPEPFRNWLTLPFICLLHRGRTMVVIFFAISGYVLCRHIIKSIQEHDLETARRRLTSAVFRRVFRLYIPAIISMFLVMMLAQIGAFPTLKGVYEGSPSKFIHGWGIDAWFSNDCPAEAVQVVGVSGVQEYLGLQSTESLDDIITVSDRLCIKRTIGLWPPSDMPQVALQYLSKPPPSRRNSTESDQSTAKGKATTATTSAPKSETTIHWVQYGGLIEEHPWNYGNLFVALQTFVWKITKWANPYGPAATYLEYDPHTWTLPIELRGSMVVYTYLLGTMALKTHWRLVFAGLFSIYTLRLGYWDMSTFLGGAALSELGIWASSLLSRKGLHVRLPTASRAGADKGLGNMCCQWSCSMRLLRWLAFVLALFMLSYPDAGAEYTPGFVLLSQYRLGSMEGWQFYSALGALLLVPSIVHSPTLSRLLNASWIQYLGRISFSLYLVHGPILHSIGFWIMPPLFERFGKPTGYVISWFILLTISVFTAHIWHKKVDAWCTSIGKRLESAMNAS